MSIDAIVSTALAQVGKSYSADHDGYDLLLQLPDADARAMYSCGLTCRAVLRIAQVDGAITWRGKPLEVLRDPYAACAARGCYAITCVVALGQARGLYVAANAVKMPGPGDMVIIGGAVAGWGGVEHVFTVTGRDGEHIESVDGGQTDAANGWHGTAIHLCHRVLVPVPAHRELWVVTPGARIGLDGRPVPGAGRRVQGWVKAGELPCLPSQPGQ